MGQNKYLKQLEIHSFKISQGHTLHVKRQKPQIKVLSNLEKELISGKK